MKKTSAKIVKIVQIEAWEKIFLSYELKEAGRNTLKKSLKQTVDVT